MSVGTVDMSPPLSSYARQGLLLAVGFVAMYGPIYWAAASGIWQSEEHGHMPIVLLVSAWVIWSLRGEFVALPDAVGARILGGSLFATGSLMYFVGRLFSMASIEFMSQILVIAAMAAALKGLAGVRLLWFPLAYLLFAVPLPGPVVEAITSPLKHWIAVIVVDSLYALGMPIAREGVTISAGPYRLLVADACSGINSMFSLASVGVLYLYLTRRARWFRNVFLSVSVVPIAFGANIVRVAGLVLITYYAGDAAGQGFLHVAGGLVMYLAALAAFLSIDLVMSTVSRTLIDSPKSGSPS